MLADAYSICTRRLCSGENSQFQYRGSILEQIGTKILILLLNAILTVTPPADFNTPFSVVLGLEILTGTVESGGLALFTLSLCLPLKVTLFFLL